MVTDQFKAQNCNVITVKARDCHVITVKAKHFEARFDGRYVVSVTGNLKLTVI